MEGYHESVLLREAINALIPPPGGGERDAWYIDCTLGDGGHSIEIIKRGGKVLGIDVDPQALLRVQKRFEEQGIDRSKYRLVQGNFKDINKLQMDMLGSKFAGAIFDLGVSSLQLESPERGFSFSKMGPLDMRMDPTLKVRALDLVNVLSRKELYELFSKLGEEKFAKTLADAVVSTREVRPIQSTRDLAEIVEKRLGRREKIHPATRIFQALRIAVNYELEALEEGLDQVKDLIKKDGHIVVISFHSLEDRVVKLTFREWEMGGLGKVLTKKPVLPTEGEVEQNPRSRSAKMRVFEI